LPVELNLDALRIGHQNELSIVNYHNLMLDRQDETSDERIKTLGEIERDKLRIARTYNKRVKEKSLRRFCLSDPKAIGSGSGRQIAKDHIELRK
jgi:hypothetical protein